MAVGIYLKNYTDTNGKQALQLKCRTKGLSFTKSIGINVDPKDWDSKNLRIKNAIPATADKLSKIRDNMFHSWELYEAGVYTFEEMTRRLSSGNTSEDVLTFIADVFSINRTKATTQSYINAIKAFKLVLGMKTVSFNHLNYSNISQAINKWKYKGLSGASIRSYINHIGAIVNEAFRRGLVDSPFKNHPSYRQKKVTKVIQTATPELFREAITKVKDLRDFQTLSFWLLQFTLRGMYTSDLATMHLHSLENASDYDSNRYVNHRRHKTGEAMTILYSCKPTEDIILALQNSIYITHKHRPQLLPDRTSTLQLFVYDFEDHRVHKNTWDIYAKRSSRILLPFSAARKTFESYALMLNTSAEIRYRLLGHTDTSIKSFYQNWEWSELSKQIDAAHLSVLKAFDTEALFNELIDKVTEVSNEVTKDSLKLIHLSNY
jgi:hypothetical protein